MIIAIEICQDNFIYCKIWTQNLDVKTFKKPKEMDEVFYFQFQFWHMQGTCACIQKIYSPAPYTYHVRNWIMPINWKYKLGLLLETLREELHFKDNYKVLFEYVMLSGVNDRLVKPIRFSTLFDLDILFFFVEFELK